MRLSLIAVAAVAALAMAAVAVLSQGDLAYAWRVIRHGESSTDDLHWKRHTTIPSSASQPWPVSGRGAGPGAASAGCDDVARAAGGDLDAVLLPGGATQLVVVRGGSMLCAWSAPGHRIDEPRPLFSITKTITALLVSRAVEAGRMSWDDPITRWIPELARRDRRFAGITLSDLVDMRSGIAFDVVARFPWFDQDAPRVYYASDLEAATLGTPRITSSPGVFTYNDWAPNLLGIAYRRATGGLMSGPAAAALWSDIGAEHPAWWLVDDHGFPWHESGFVASAPDLARVGLLLLERPGSGFARRSAAAMRTPVVSDRVGAPPGYGEVPMGYGNGLWILHDTAQPAYAALGYHGEVMVVDPRTDTVIVRLGDSGHEAAGPEPRIAARLEQWARRL
jgi:CubicO group peptidase (beta-lactamase class C family)